MRRFLLSVIACVYVSIGMWAQGIFEADGNTVYVNHASAGQFAQQFNKDDYVDGTRFVFGNDCVLDQDDVNAILTSGTDQKKFYVDFFDVTNNGQMSASDIDPLITTAVNSMASTWKSQKGIFLPYNSTLGTSAAIKWNGNTGNSGSTFSEYAAYYRESETAKNLVLHVWDMSYWNGWGSVAEANYNTAQQHLNTHPEIKNAETVLISTVADKQFDLSKFTASKVEVEIECDDMVGHAPNINIPDKANIIVKTSVPDAFAAHISTAGTKNTPTDLLKISGPVSCEDVAAITQFTAGGPRVLDLREATYAENVKLEECVSNIVNEDIEYILLPYGWEKSKVNLAAKISNMPGLKAAISVSADKKDLVAYINEPGSLAEARVLYTGGVKPGENGSTVFAPTTTYVLTNVTLSGNLNASDIWANTGTGDYKVDYDGNAYKSDESGKTNNGNKGLAGETLNIKSLDLTDAVFGRQENMNLHAAGFSTQGVILESVKFPTSSLMNTIPEDCLNTNHSLTYICIPSNYKFIGKNAFYDTKILTITTDNENHTLIVGRDGETYGDEELAKSALMDTYTFSSNVELIQTGAFQTQSHSLTDVYVLATTTPKCEKDAFSEGMYQGWGGFQGGDYPYCRQKYENNGIMFTILHYPNQPSNMTDADYTQMEKNYTDITKKYTQADQTGALDGNGNPILWPSHTEGRRVWYQACGGYTWKDWNETYDAQGQVNGMNDKSGGDVTVLTERTIGENGNCTFNDYIGWHQFVLTIATYVPNIPNVDVVTKEFTLNYVQDEWFTFCVPYNMTRKQVIEFLGVPESYQNGSVKFTHNYTDGDGTTHNAIEEPVLPEIRTLTGVTRFPNSTQILLHLSLDLATKDGTGADWNVNDNFQGGTYTALNGTDDDILIKGGHPYFIKPYKPVGTTISNLGKYVLSRNNFTYEEVGNKHEGTQFAAPFTGHHVQAFNGDETGDGAGDYMVYGGEGEDKDDAYLYTFQGNYTMQTLPLYSYYLGSYTSNGKRLKKFYYYSQERNGYNWNPYVSIIFIKGNVGYELPDKIGEDSEGRPIYNGSMVYTFDGTASDDFISAGAKQFSFIFDDGIEESINGDVTLIEKLDGKRIPPVNGIVYNMNGQNVGSSINGLSKGIYILNGKKYIVK